MELLTTADVLSSLKRSSTEQQAARVAAQGIQPKYVLGTSKKFINAAANSIGKNHALAIALWGSLYHEARLLAVLIAEPAKMDFALQKAWATQLWSWGLCDQFARYLLPYLTRYDRLIAYGVEHSGLYVQRMAFAGIACCLVRREDITESQIEQYLKNISHGALDNRHHVRAAVVWALVEIGKSNFTRHEIALIHAAELMAGDKAQQWVGRNALRELELLVKVDERERLISSKSKTGSKRTVQQ